MQRLWQQLSVFSGPWVCVLPRVLVGLVLLPLNGCGEPAVEISTATRAEIDREAPTIPEDSERPDRIVAIGDLHGDLDATRRALRLGGIIDDADRWIGATAIVVQTGDVLDRGDDERAIVDLLLDLQSEAAAAGGALHVLSGNHEILTVYGEHTYVTDGACDAFADVPGLDLDSESMARARLEIDERCWARAAAFESGGPYAIRVAEWPVTVIVGRTLFVHGGVLPVHIDYGLDRINAEVRAWMRGERPEAPGPVAYTSQSLVWLTLYSEAEVVEAACERLQQVLDRVDVDQMVVGHVVHETINSACDGRIWRIDTGMSAHFGGPVEVLEIVDGEVRIRRETSGP